MESGLVRSGYDNSICCSHSPHFPVLLQKIYELCRVERDHRTYGLITCQISLLISGKLLVTFSLLGRHKVTFHMILLA